MRLRMTSLGAVRLVAGAARRWVCLSLAMASALLMSVSPPASAAPGPRFRDGLMMVVSGVPQAPASLMLSFDHGRASVLFQHLLERPSLTGLPLSGGAEQFNSRADGFTLQAVSAQTLARVSMGLEVLKPGRPITGGASIPHGTTVVVVMPDGHQMLLRDGRFSIPTTAAGIGFPVRPELTVEPQRVRPGDAISVTGDVGSRCAIGQPVTLTSAAFAGSAGDRSKTTVVLHEGGFDLRTTIPRSRHRGRYAIRARCAGGGLGVASHLALTGAPGAVPQSSDLDCAPGQFSVYICVRMHSLALGTTMTQGKEWHSCGGTTGAPAATLSYGQVTTFNAYCAVDFWGDFEYQFTIPPYNTRGVFMVESYSTFTGNSDCEIYNAGSLLNLSCPAGDGPMLLVNPKVKHERAHYYRLVEIQRPPGPGG